MNAVVTVTIGQEYERLARLTHPTISAYASKIGADFVVFDKKEVATTTPHFEKLKIYHLLNKYERIIYLDTDVIVRRDCPNLFNIVPEGKLGIFNNGAFLDCLPYMQQACKQYSVEVPEWKRDFYNTGVMVISRHHKFLFEKPQNECAHSLNDQGLLNLRFAIKKPDIHRLSYEFNRMTFMDTFTGEPRHASYIVHYSGAPNKTSILGLITRDLMLWEDEKLDFPRNIHIKAHGGMGDQMCAEPVVRYIVQKAYKGANVTVETWYPRLFKHLPVKLFQMNLFSPEPDMPYYVMEPLQSPENQIWRYASANLMHNTDFAAISCLKKILPDEDKQFKLSVSPDEIAEASEFAGVPLSELVLVHPGKGWPSKTFPTAWWQAVINGLTAAGHKVAVIGKNINEDQGLVDIKVPNSGVDLRNGQTLGGLIATISQAKMLVTNDSAPLHFAGAFDNNIIVIPTCKHPDHILPIRNGSRHYKTKALYKRLMCDEIDSTPTKVHGQTIDKVPGGNILEFIPDPELVIATTREMR